MQHPIVAGCFIFSNNQNIIHTMQDSSIMCVSEAEGVVGTTPLVKYRNDARISCVIVPIHSVFAFLGMCPQWSAVVGMPTTAQIK